jgi:hypothetical protein
MCYCRHTGTNSASLRRTVICKIQFNLQRYETSLSTHYGNTENTQCTYITLAFTALNIRLHATCHNTFKNSVVNELIGHQNSIQTARPDSLRIDRFKRNVKAYFLASGNIKLRPSDYSPITKLL